MTTPNQEQIEKAREIAYEVVRRYLPDESSDVGRGRRCVEYIETQIRKVLADAAQPIPVDVESELAEAQQLFERTTQEHWRAVALLPDAQNHHIIAGEWSNQTAIATDDNPNGLVVFADRSANTDWIAAAHNLWPKLIAALKGSKP